MRLTKQIDLEELGYDYVLIDETNQPSANYKLGQLEDIEDELGVELSLFFKIMKTETLWWKDKNKKHTHNIASEFISIKPYWSIGAGMMFEFSWNDRHIDAYTDCDVIIKEQESPIGMPHIYLYLKASEYGKTWALTKEELEK